jgi:hypothetical protein
MHTSTDSKEGAELCAFIDFLYREAINKHGIPAQEVQTGFVDILTGCKDPQLLLEVA